MHVLKSEPVISELRIPVRSLRLRLCLRRVIVLWGDSPAGGNIPANLVGRRVMARGVSAVYGASWAGVHPSAVLPLLWIYSWRRRWDKGLVVSRMGGSGGGRGRMN